MPEWVPVTLVLVYAGMVVLMALASVFSETEPRRDAAYKVLRVMLPWGAVSVAAHAIVSYAITGM
ncbi:hypothetical protein GA0070558_13433 [Micromonospora haikouensis]|uniref:Uncharacterized protein n=1 Tax=Micromonospora haikouensis TaxID=686309 RepID=A0A1C4Y323_9ACTN|nr:hypothetical protein [Micromonospora haikouensis]SCF15113.1 hypothetical protein GA0070558_13433 [Micromonospora haikouensis]